MDSKIKDKLKEVINKIKSKEGIANKSPEEIQSLLKEELSSSLNISPEKWKLLAENKMLKFDLENMSIQEDSLDTMSLKLAKKIKKGEQAKEENSPTSGKKFKFVVTLNNSFKNKIISLDKQQGFLEVKNAIINQAASQGISLEMLEKPCSEIKNLNTNLKLTLPKETKYIDAIAFTSYTNIMGKDVFNREKIDENDKPHYEEESAINELINDFLGKNDTKFGKDDEMATVQRTF